MCRLHSLQYLYHVFTSQSYLSQYYSQVWLCVFVVLLVYIFVVEAVTYVAVLLIKGEIVLENMSEIFMNPLPSAYLCLYCMEILCKYTVC